MSRWAPAVLLALFALVSLIRTGVSAIEIVRFSGYWLFALLLPGWIVARRLRGPARNAVEDLSIAAATGLSLEVLSVALGIIVGIADVTRWWWAPVIVLGLSRPTSRERLRARVPDRLAPLTSAALAFVGFLVLLRIDVKGFRQAPLPPTATELNQDLWWHLALVQEMMRFERPQVPQIVGEPLAYHFFSHLHLAAGTKLSGIDPEVVLLRLSLVPLALASVGLAFAFGRVVTSSVNGGLASAVLGYGVELQSYLWVDLPVLGAHPIAFTSPSQVLGNISVLACAVALVPLLRQQASRGEIAWAVLMVAGASGAKSTILPLLIAATSVTLIVTVVRRDPRWRQLIAAVAGMMVMQVIVLALASAKGGGKVILLGTLRSFEPYRTLVDDTSLRATNDGLLLDSVSTPYSIAIASLFVLVFYGLHSIRLAGLVLLFKRSANRDLVVWWVSAAVAAGYVVSMLIDHVGLSQVWFVLAVAPLGVALSVHAFLQLVPRSSGASVRSIALVGLGAGAVLKLSVDYTLRARRATGAAGALENVLIPMVVVAAVGVVVLIVGRFTPVPTRLRVRLPALALAATIGVAIPNQLESYARYGSQWIGSIPEAVSEPANDYVTTGELEAMLWLRDNSAASDVIVTNVQCRPIRRQFAPCDARGFWVVGLSGRRAVLEGYAYTAAAQQLQGVDGRVWSLQPSLYPERDALSEAVFRSDESALRQLETDFGVRWIVLVHRGSEEADFSPVPGLEFDDSTARVRFENGEVSILEVVPT